MDTPRFDVKLEYLGNLVSDWQEGGSLSPKIVEVLEKSQITVAVVTLWYNELLPIEDMNSDMKYFVNSCFDKIQGTDNDDV